MRCDDEDDQQVVDGDAWRLVFLCSERLKMFRPFQLKHTPIAGDFNLHNQMTLSVLNKCVAVSMVADVLILTHFSFELQSTFIRLRAI